MGFPSDKNSHSFGQSCFQLLIKLIDANSVDKIKNGIIIGLAPEYNSNVKSNKDIIVGWASSHWELISDVLLGDKELDFGPRKTENEATILFHLVKFPVFRNHSICSFRNIDIRKTRAAIWD